MPNISEDEILDYIIFDCKARGQDWKNIEWYIDNPKLIEGDFYHINSGVLVFNEKVYDSELFTILEMAGEILPISVKDKRLYLLNVLECINSLDHQNTEFDYYDDGTQGRILKYVFHERFPDSSLFKIPETSRSEVLTYHDVKDTEDEFYSLYNKLKFSGLIFQELYSI